MEVRLSPYNSPFIPAGDNSGIYWVALEYQSAPHDEHVRAYFRSLPSHNTNFTHEEFLELTESFYEYGIQAAGRRLGLI